MLLDERDIALAVSARGLFDERPRDVVGLAVAYGYFSEKL